MRIGVHVEANFHRRDHCVVTIKDRPLHETFIQSAIIAQDRAQTSAKMFKKNSMIVCLLLVVTVCQCLAGKKTQVKECECESICVKCYHSIQSEWFIWCSFVRKCKAN